MKFMRPDENMVLYGSVTGGAATNYLDDWLVDGKPGRPAKEPNGSPGGIAWAITGLASMEVGLVVIANHNLQAGLTIPVTGGGGLSATITTPTARANGIPFNAWAETVTPVTTNTITVTIPPNSADIIVGEVLAGKLREVDPGILMGDTWEFLAGSELPYGTATALPGYDNGVVQRAVSCTVYGTQATKDLLEGWWEATRGNTRPSVLIPHDCINDAMVGHLTRFSAQTASGLWRVTFTFVEYARTRW